MRPRDKLIMGAATFGFSLWSVMSLLPRVLRHPHPGHGLWLVAAMPIAVLGIPLAFWSAKLFGLLPRFRVRAPVLAGGPVATRMLAEGTRVSAELGAPEARALFAEAHRALYRLTRRAEELARPTRPGHPRRRWPAACSKPRRRSTSASRLLPDGWPPWTRRSTARARGRPYALSRRSPAGRRPSPPTSGPRSTTPAGPWRPPSSGATPNPSASSSPPRSVALWPPCATSAPRGRPDHGQRARAGGGRRGARRACLGSSCPGCYP